MCFYLTWLLFCFLISIRDHDFINWYSFKSTFENIQWKCKFQFDTSQIDFFVLSQDIIQGTVIISTPNTFKHNGISLTVDGSVQLHLSGKSVGVFEAFYNSTKVNKC